MKDPVPPFRSERTPAPTPSTPAPEGAEPTRSAEPVPASPAGRPLQVIRTGPFSELVEASVRSVLDSQVLDLATRRKMALSADVRRRVLRGIREQGRAVRGMTRAEFLEGLERSRDQILASLARAREELAATEQAPRRPPSDADPTSFDRHHRPDVRRRIEVLLGMLSEGRLSRLELQQRMLAVIADVARSERRSTLEAEEAGRRDRVEVLERRIAKLHRALSEAENALHRVHEREETGIESIFRSVQGLDMHDANAAAKLGMLTRIFEENRILRRIS